MRIDAKRCAPGYKMEGADFHGACEEASGILGGMQKDLDALGAELKAALGQ